MPLSLWSLLLVLLATPAVAQSNQPGWAIDPRSGCKIWNAFPVSSEQLFWSGACVNDMADGKGILQWVLGGKPTPKKYDGEMREGRMNGKGVLVFTNGDKYDGEFKDGERTGRGKMTWYNRNTYDGMWQDGLPEGRGTYDWYGGNTYIGDWVKGKPNGKGIFKFSNGSSYEGEFREGIMEGRGKFRWATGDTYEGLLKNEVPHGLGTFKVYNSGFIHHGIWDNGCLQENDDMIAVNQSEMACRLKKK